MRFPLADGGGGDLETIARLNKMRQYVLSIERGTSTLAITQTLVGTALKPAVFRWSETDAILYALAVGARPPRDLAYLDEQHGPAVLP